MTTAQDKDRVGVARALELFKSIFSDTPTIAAAAPGRVNLIGEHVDYNDGFVFPLALQKSTYIVAAPLPPTATTISIVSEAFRDGVATIVPGDSPFDPAAPHWSRYVKGMTAIYARNAHPIRPFHAAIVSDVPRGSGLSSSAALEMATGIVLELLSELTVDPSDRAKMGQTCEHEFAGVPCGIMDQLISSRGQVGRALLIDCRSLDVTPVPLDHPDAVIVVANSRVAHELSGTEYPERRQACMDAAKAMAKRFPDLNISHLRDCDEQMLQAVESDLGPTTVKRARHAIREDVRTLKARECLENGDLNEMGRLMYSSHVSLRDLFEVSTTEIDALVEIAMSVDGVYGSRITGGGFGGCTVSLVRKDAVESLMKAIDERYPEASGGLRAEVFATTAGGGARDVSYLLNP